MRTTLAAAACQLIGELAANLKESLLPLFEPLFAGLLKLASLTKKTIAQTAQDSANIMLKDCPYHPKSLPMLAALLDQKNVAARIYAAQHFKTLIEAQGKKYKEAIETSVNAGLPLLSQMLKKQLADANATVREIARTTFWLVYEIWPETGQTILESVDTAARKGIEKVDNRATRRESSQARSDSLAPARKPAAGRPSIRELISSRRAAQSVAVAASDDLSASTQASANMQGDEDLTAPVDISPSRVHNELQLPVTSSSKQAPSPSLNSNARTPTKRPTSIYGHSSMSHIPSPSRSNQHSPRSRTFSGETGQRRSFSHTYGSPPYQSNGQSIRDGSSTPVQTALPIDQGAEASQMSRNSSRSSSPSLRAPAVENDYSDIEASTFNAMPDGLDSTDDESVNLLNYDATVLHQTGGDITAFDISERSRILDGLMDTTFRMPENTEVEEAVKGLADQAEQTAHRFLELTEFDNDASGGDTTILEQSHADAQNSYPSDIPVPYTPVAHGGQERRTAAAFTVEPAANDTPLLQKLQALHLPDSPMNGSSARPTSAVLTTFAQDEWWISKANCKYVFHVGDAY